MMLFARERTACTVLFVDSDEATRRAFRLAFDSCREFVALVPATVGVAL